MKYCSHEVLQEETIEDEFLEIFDFYADAIPSLRELSERNLSGQVDYEGYDNRLTDGAALAYTPTGQLLIGAWKDNKIALFIYDVDLKLQVSELSFHDSRHFGSRMTRYKLLEDRVPSTEEMGWLKAALAYDRFQE